MDLLSSGRSAVAGPATVPGVNRDGNEISAELIRDLLRDQHPDLAGLPLGPAAKGWANQTWRLGGELAVRLPWMTRDGTDLRKEHAWVPGLAPHLPLPVPVPQRLGEPSDRFPRPWLVTTWVPGEPADRVPVTRGDEAADALAAFLGALHRPAPDRAPEGGDDRGRPLAEVAEYFPRQLRRLADRGLIPDPDAVRAVWDDAVAAPAWTRPPTWIHADLHPANVLTAGGTLCGVIDFGALRAGDPAIDLAAAWILLPDDSVARCLAAYRPAPDAALLRRARGWAVMRAFAYLSIGDAGDRGLPGGKPTWGPPARESLQRLTASA